MRAVLDITIRDLVASLRDRSAIVLGLVAPLGLILVFSFLIEGPDVENQPIGYVAPPAGSMTDVVGSALEDGAFPALEKEGLISVDRFDSRADAVEAVKDGDVDAALVPTSAGAADGKASIEVIRSAASPFGGSIAEGIAQDVAARVNAVTLVSVAEAQLGQPVPSPESVIQRLAEGEPAVSVRTATGDARGISAKTQLAAGMATFFLFFTVQFGLLGLLQERREGTLARLLAAPISPAQILLAKLLVSFVLGVLATTALLIISRFLLGATFSNPFGVALLILAGVAAATATTALVVGVAKNAEQAGMAQSMVALVLGLMGGSFFSMTRNGGLMAGITKLTPHYWFSDGLVRMNLEGSWTGALVPVAMMLLFAAVVGVPGLLLARRTVRP